MNENINTHASKMFIALRRAAAVVLAGASPGGTQLAACWVPKRAVAAGGTRCSTGLSGVHCRSSIENSPA